MANAAEEARAFAAAVSAAEDAVARAIEVAPPTACLLRPSSFFAAWAGVLCLAFTGWPPSLASLKAALNAAPGLRPEAAGSRWPKATLAATADGAPPLTLAELRALRALCESHGGALRALCEAAPVAVDALSLVRYEQRGLEARGAPAARALPLAQPPDAARPSAAEAARVEATLGEWEGERLEAYLEGANRLGARIGSYREGSPRGATLVAFLDAEGALAAALDAFQGEVDARFPGRFEWLDRGSLHATVRGLVW